MDAPGWQPDPLELPLDDEEPRRRIREREDDEEPSDLPGSYVIVIDLN
jgi:hypothetical protein